MTMGLENFQSIINNTFASSPVVLATIFAVILNLVLPKASKAGKKIKGNRSLRKRQVLGERSVRDFKDLIITEEPADGRFSVIKEKER